MARSQPTLPSNRAFVVQFGTQSSGAPPSWAGRVEHLVSHQVARFQSLDELLAFMSRVLMEVDGVPRALCPGMKQHIRPGEKHRFTGLEESEIIEFSTHHVEEDSYRDEPSGRIPEAEFAALRERYAAE